ncbi:MAG: RHS repeat-associated core domain-containing protein [Chloroflexota bacterium]
MGGTATGGTVPTHGWGHVHQGGIDSSTTTLNFTGQRRDDTGLLYYHARYYDPQLGRFLSPDTLVPDPTTPQDLNRYTYVRNNPLRYTDPTGHRILDGTDAGSGGSIGGGAVISAGMSGGSQMTVQAGAYGVGTGTAAALTVDGMSDVATAPRQGGRSSGSWAMEDTPKPAAQKPLRNELGGQPATPPQPTPEGDGDDPWERTLFRNYNEKEQASIRRIMEHWDKGKYDSRAHSIVDHTSRKGFGNNYLGYARGANRFRTNVRARGVRNSGLREDGSIRYWKKSGEFVILRDGKIVSYGFNRVP